MEYLTEEQRSRAEARELARAGREVAREETRAKREFERAEREQERLRRRYAAPSPPVAEAPEVAFEVREVGEPKKAKRRKRRKKVTVEREVRRVMYAKEKPPYAVPLRHVPRKPKREPTVAEIVAEATHYEPEVEAPVGGKTDKEILSEFLS